MINPEKLNFKHLIMTIGNLPSSYVESLSYYECLLWLCNYLENTVIPAVNNNAEALKELQNLFVELKAYVDNYFENLDVQEEINKKLDEMAESGELGEIISVYVNPILEEFETTINGEVSALNTKVDNNYTVLNDKLSEIITGGIAPIPVSNTSQMTDTSRIYVNTTDGNWYYYDGDSWEIGGTYQASEDSTDLMIALKTAQGNGIIFTRNGLYPFKNIYYGYLSNTTGEYTSNNSRLYTAEYVEDKVQRIMVDSGYAISVYCFNKNDDTYAGRVLTTYEVSTASPSAEVANKWFTDLDLNFIRGKFPNYNIKLVFRKDDYSSITNVATFLTHFKTYVKNEVEEYTFNQNTEYECNIDSIWSIGEIEGSTGDILDTNYRFYTNTYVPEYISKAKGINDRIFRVACYTSDGTYMGRLRTDGRIDKTTGYSALTSIVNFDDLRRKYPGYKFKLSMFVTGSTTAVQIMQSRNGLFICTRKVQSPIQNRKHYGYDVKALANTANHDMTYVGDYIYLFDAPTSEYAGKFNILDSNLDIVSTKYTNFNYLLSDGTTRSYLRMKSVDFNPSNNVLLVANGQVPVLTGDSYLFLFYDALDWRTSSTVTFTFDNCGEYKKIDLTALGDRVYCFWKSYKNTNEIYVTIDNLEKIYLIELGKGSNNLGMGTYESTTSDKYNGSYRIVSCYEQLNKDITPINAHGGQVYNGDLYLASNDEFEAVIYKAIFGNDGSLRFDILDINDYEAGKIKYSYFDGMLIKDGTIIADPLKINEVYNTGTNKVLMSIDIKN